MFSIKEELGLGKGYIYCSKNAVDDTLAAANFGKAAAWVSGAAVVVGQRVVSVSIQYKNLTGVNTTTAPASDLINWAFDFENFQPYLTTKTYHVGDKTVSGNLHYICNTDETTGAFNAANWTQVPISNRSCPYKLMNTAIVMLNADARFVSYELLDLVNNTATHNIHLLISNGVWNETLTAPTKYVKIIGQSKWKTIIYNQTSYSLNLTFYQNIRGYLFGQYPFNYTPRVSSCVLNLSFYADWGNMNFSFSYKNIFVANTSRIAFSHCFNCTFLFNITDLTTASGYLFPNTNIYKNNYFHGNIVFPSLASVNVGNIDGNYYGGTVLIAGVNQTSIAMIKATAPFQNQSSYKGSAVTLNTDYTLPSGCTLLNAGLLGNHIGAEGLGVTKDTTNSLLIASGATYKNLMLSSNNLYREQVAKNAQSGGSTNTIKLNVSASTISEEYTGFRVWIYQGAGSGDTKTITAYDGSTKIATVNTNWTGSTPDNTSYYEIMDAELISPIVDLGSVRPIKKLNFSTLNNYDTATSTILTQHVSTDDCRLYNSELNYELKGGQLSDLSDGTWVKFKQDYDLEIDTKGRGNGDPLYVPENVIANSLNMRYYQVKIKFHK